MRSGSRLEVAVTSAPNAAVTVAAVDEGILQLIAQRTPDPFTFFYRKLRLGVRSFNTFSLLLPEIEAPEKLNQLSVKIIPHAKSSRFFNNFALREQRVSNNLAYVCISIAENTIQCPHIN